MPPSNPFTTTLRSTSYATSSSPTPTPMVLVTTTTPRTTYSTQQQQQQDSYGSPQGNVVTRPTRPTYSPPTRSTPTTTTRQPSYSPRTRPTTRSPSTQGPDSIEKFWFGFGLKNGSRFRFDSETCLNYPILNVFLV